MRISQRRAALVFLAAAALAATAWYLHSGGAETLLVGCTLAALVLVIPLIGFKGRTASAGRNVAMVWALGGILGAYGFGDFVLLAGLLAFPLSLIKDAPVQVCTGGEVSPADF